CANCIRIRPEFRFLFHRRSGGIELMNLPKATLKSQLEAAYLALETLGRERSRLRSEIIALDAALKNAQSNLDAALKNAQTQGSNLRSQIVASNAALKNAQSKLKSDVSLDGALTTAQAERDRLRVAYEILIDTLAKTTNQLSTAEESHRVLSLQLSTEREMFAQTLNSVYSSFSWRITKPLRATSRFVHGLPGTLRSVTRFVRRIVLWGVNGTLNLTLNLLTQLAAVWRSRFGRPRTMWGVTPILTLPLLAKCDRLLGFRSEALVFTTYHTTQSFDINLKNVCETVYTKYPRWTVRLHKIILRLALIRYDVFHMFCDRSLLLPTRRMEINTDEMKAIRNYGRRLYTYTYGADVRTRQATLALGRYNLCAECPEPG